MFKVPAPAPGWGHAQSLPQRICWGHGLPKVRLLSGTPDLGKGFYKYLPRFVGGGWAERRRAVPAAAEVGYGWEPAFAREGLGLPL